MRVLWAIAMAFAVSGCMSDNPQSTTSPSNRNNETQASTDSGTPAVSRRQAWQIAKSLNGIEAELYIDNNNLISTRTPSSNPSSDSRVNAIMDTFVGDSATTYGTFSHRFSVRADRNPQLSVIRDAGENIYLFVGAGIITERKHVSSGRVEKSALANHVIEGAGRRCGGYYIVLGPHNNYRFENRRNVEHTIRFRNSSWGGQHWEANAITGAAVVHSVNDKPFTERHASAARQSCMAPGMERYWR